MSWWDDFFGKQWTRDEKYDPLGHKLVEKVVQNDSRGIGVGARHLASMTGGNKTLVGHWFTDIGNEAGRNEQDPKRGVGRAALTAGAIFGGEAALGAMGGSGAGAAGAGDAAGAAAGDAAGGAAAGDAAGAGAAAGGAGAGDAAAGAGAAAGGAAAGGSGGAGAAGGAVGGDAMGGSAGTLGAADSQAANAELGLGANTGGVPAQVTVDGTTYNTGQSGLGQWGRLASRAGSMMGRGDDPRIQSSNVQFAQPDLSRDYGFSSKTLKNPGGRARMADVLQAGASGADPLSENGVHIAAVQALSKRLEAAKQELAALKGAESEESAAPAAAPRARMQETSPTVDDAAHDAATSPANDRPEPTDAQKKAGNYALGHVRINGLEISIENPQGSVRRGTDRDGKAWENELQDHYGYIRGTVGNDKDHVDVFVKPGTPADFDGQVYVVDQVHPDSGDFDEHKALIGYGSKTEAKAAYQANYADDWQGLKAITAMPFDEFKAWAKDGQKTTPISRPAPRARARMQQGVAR